MTVHLYNQRQHLASYQGDQQAITQIAEIAKDIYPQTKIVFSDEDLTQDQLDILQDIHDYQLTLSYNQPH